MKVFSKILGLLLASLALGSCGGGGSNGGAFSPPQSGSITLTATTTTLPLNISGLLPHDHGPNQAEVNITLRNADGSLMVGHDVQVSISPVEVAALSFLVSTDNPNFDTLWGTFPIKGTNGQATAWVNAGTTAGTAVLTASAVDPTTTRTISQTLTFTITSGVGPAPASVALVPNPAGVYLPSSGGSNTSVITATVLDGAGQFVPDPVSGNSGVDNVQFDIVGNAGDARLSSSSVAGAVSGTSVKSHTVHGVAVASFQAGEATPQGPVQIRVTADRADNNVDNGIQDPISFATSVIVSDGKLYSIEITTPLVAPNLPGITINCVTDPCAAVSAGATASVIPVNPDATLSLVVTAKAQDRQGNPVIRGTPIRFGSVDEPVGAPGSAQDNQFLLSGLNGNPQEGGTTFTAPTGQFTTAGGGAGPGDALVVFGKAVQGNADLESAVTVQSVNSATNLTASPGFNLNDTTGVSVDSGSVLPYLIGRSLHGSITAVAATDANLAAGSAPTGIAHASLTYTVNTVGNAVAIWAQGDGIDRVTSGSRRVTDAGTLVYPGVAPISIVASPNPIPGNTSTPQTVTVCVTDALGIRLRGVTLGFNFILTAGTGSVDGHVGSGALGHPTGVNGCVEAAVTTSGLPVTAAGGNSGTLTFSAGGATSTINIIVQLAFLNASPPAVCAKPTPGTSVIVTAYSTAGGPVSGIALSATCTSTVGTITVDPTSATTDATGSALFHVVGVATDVGQCVFASAGASLQSVTVNVGPGSVSPVCGGP